MSNIQTPFTCLRSGAASRTTVDAADDVVCTVDSVTEYTRARVFAVPLPSRPAPWDRCLGHVYYRAEPPDQNSRDTGLLQPVTTHGKRPVVIVLPGMNLPCSSYTWLAHRLVDAQSMRPRPAFR